jgi:Uma2 family endonuclease
MEARLPEYEPDPELDPDAFYHPHEEDSVPESGIHHEICCAVEAVLALHQPERWVSGNLCCYWIPRNNRAFLVPDVFVAACPRPDPVPDSFCLWRHGPLLLVVEIGSDSSLKRDQGPKLEEYAEGLRPDEYLFFDADHGVLRLHRRTDLGYVEVQPDAEGRVWSEGAQAGFRIEGDHLRLFDAEGEPLLFPAEIDLQRRIAERRAEAAERERDELAERMAALEAELARLQSNGRG